MFAGLAVVFQNESVKLTIIKKKIDISPILNLY